MTQVQDVNIADKFRKYFTVELADTEEKKRKVYNIRYHVYCQEFGYESAEQFPNEMEIDEYDDDSVHCLITHKSSNTPAACVRLVPKFRQYTLEPLPFEKYCSESIDSEKIKGLRLDQTKECEISRLAVDGKFRKRKKERSTRFGDVDISKEEERTFLLIAVAAFFSAIALTEISNRTNMFAMMEPFLPRLLNRSGLFFQKVGKDIDYHGTRAPYFLTTQSALDNIRPELLDLYFWIHKELQK